MFYFLFKYFSDTPGERKFQARSLKMLKSNYSSQTSRIIVSSVEFCFNTPMGLLKSVYDDPLSRNEEKARF